jgi:hypothetical protein
LAQRYDFLGKRHKAREKATGNRHKARGKRKKCTFAAFFV